ncbi:translation initiation factor IF-2-like [Phoenix dactylifera]|uniref:Translation initiation factor IF-2-like n=1 Tax=Phoenix dactylifera TaxID=42345 RepID=A0A8B9AZE3_PHODC|nr:translation initiation factor IF-2-like [Phoenix dactylifera]
MSPWVPDFEPGDDTVKRALVWLRLPRLPPEYWSTSTILHIAARAGQPVAVDGVTEQQAAMGFTRVKVAIDTTEPLRPGVLIQGKTKVRWQPFVFENVPTICSRCGRMGHVGAACRFPAESSAHREAPPVATEMGGMADPPTPGGGEEAQGPVYGPWMVATRQKIPRGDLLPRPGVMTGPDPGAGSSSRPPPSPANQQLAPTAPVSPADTEGWQKPAKLARRRSPPAAEGDGLLLAPPPAFPQDDPADWLGDDLLEPTDSVPSLDSGMSSELALPRADPGTGGSAAARAQSQKRPRPPAAQGLQRGPGMMGPLAHAHHAVGQRADLVPAQRARAQGTGRRGRRPAGATRGAPAARGAQRARSAPGLRASPAVGERARDLMGQAALPVRSEGGPWAQGPHAQGTGDLRVLLGAGPEAQFLLGDRSQSDMGVGAHIAPDQQAGGKTTPVFRFGPLPSDLGQPVDAASCGHEAGGLSAPSAEAESLLLGGGTDLPTVVQRVRAAVMSAALSAHGGEEEGGGQGVEPVAVPVTLGEDGSEADYVDCDP